MYYPAEAVVHAVGPMVAKIINKEHIPKEASVIARTGHVIEVTPDGTFSHERCYLPKNEQSKHIGRPDTNDTMNDTSEVEFCKLFDLLHLLEHAKGDKEAADPEEGVHCEVGSRNESRYAWSGEDVERLCPVFDVGQAEPHIVAVYDPRNR